MLTIRKSEERGHFDHGWLDTRHTFSFAGYLDPRHMGFHALRVLNDDVVQAGRGFGEHGHDNMEIISFPVLGRLAHRDSAGHESSIGPGEVQVMTAGSGIRHSEFNHTDRPARFLQIWIEPRQVGLDPAYGQRDFAPTSSDEGLRLLVSPDGRDDSLTIQQDAEMHRLLLAAGGELEFPLGEGRAAWIQVIGGELSVDGRRLGPGDGAAIERQSSMRLRTASDVQALLFDLPT